MHLTSFRDLSNKFARPYTAGFAAAGCVFGLGIGQAHAGEEGDIGLQVINGEIVSGLIEEGGFENGGSGFEASRFFAVELGEFESEPGETEVFQEESFFNAFNGLDFFTNVPGFDTPDATFDPNSPVTFNVVGNDLLVYDVATDQYVSSNTTDGAGTSTGEESEFLAISFNDVGTETNPGAGRTSPTGTEFGVFPELNPFGNGRFHRHFIFGLGPVSGVTTLAESGAYLLLFEITATPFGETEEITSEVLGILFEFGDISAFEEAAEAAAIALVPEPTTAGVLVGFAGLALLRRRRAA